jgi:hypothetical protein
MGKGHRLKCNTLVANGRPAPFYNVTHRKQIMTLTTNDENTLGASEKSHRKSARGRAALRLSFWIHLASYVFGAAVFTLISFQANTGTYVMLLPLLWWGIGLLGHLLGVIIGELVAGFESRP